MTKTVRLLRTTAQKVLDYLQSRPWRETNQLIVEIVKETQDSEFQDQLERQNDED